MNARPIFRVTATLTIAAAGIALVSEGARAAPYVFQTLDNPSDPTFNQLLGITNAGVIAGYFGSGAAGFPNKGYTLVPPATYTNENFPGSVQTQVTGINNVGTTVGFWSDTNNANLVNNNFGFVDHGGMFTNVNNPNTGSGPAINQLLGVNDSNIAVGFYTDTLGATHGYTYNVTASTFSPNIDDPNAVGNTTAAAINDAGEIVGFYTDAGGAFHGFVDIGGVFSTVDAPLSTGTILLGLNNLGLAVGEETDASNLMHGVIFDIVTDSFTILDDPNGIGMTTFNGLNDRGSIVGFYVDGNGNTHGLLARTVPEPGSLALLAGGLLAFFGVSRRSSWAKSAQPY
jgi:hypothetical protein